VAAPRATVTLSRAVGALVTAVGVLAVSGPLTDSSFYTHLATGRIILDTGIVRTDPYTFTAAGEPWVVQSWFASVIYAVLEEAAGLRAIRLFTALLGGVIAACAWLLSAKATTLTARLVVVLPVLAIGINGWSERPLLIGLACFAGALLASEGRLDPRWLVPIGWLWVNTHGSWPLGLGVVALVAIGSRLDGERRPAELRPLAWLTAGCAAAIANPYGLRLLTFPVELLSHREELATIVEWKPPKYDRPAEQMFLVLVLVAAIGLARRRSWRVALPSVVFVVLAATGSRNILPASLVLLVGGAASLAGWGSIDGSRTSTLARPLVGAALALVLTVGAVIATSEPLDESPYPIAADAWLREHDLSPVDHRVVAREAVGNWWELRDGPTGAVFIDDRIEVIPAPVVHDFAALLEGDPAWESILGRYEPEAVLWEADKPLADLLAADASWEIEYRDEDFVVAVPVGG
jgi:hypothetical protein